jgi:hypothetical protein
MIEKLGNYPLSVILSYLEETEGCSLLLTRTKWAHELLPVFRVPSPLRIGGARNRHKFRVYPVQDAKVRLEQLNTKTLRRRRQRPENNSTTAQLAYQEWKEDKSRKYPPLLRFLREADSKEHIFLKGITLLVSYPRSGNTMLRSLLERATGLVTGSDTRPDRTLSLALAERHGLVGEGICSNVVFCKTHWPERIGCQFYKGNRAIMLVRNPFDAIDSMWNLNATNTHTEKITEDVYKEHWDFYCSFVRNEMKIWLKFHDFWDSQSIPLLWVRYEDLIMNTQHSLHDIMKFSTVYNSTFWEHRIDGALNSGSYGYRSRDQSPSFGKSLQRFPETLVKELHSLDEKGWLKRFGYHKYDQDFPNNFSSNTAWRPEWQQHDMDHRTEEDYVFVNQPNLDLRPRNCPYGRLIRDWRRLHTKDDTKPFPIKKRGN